MSNDPVSELLGEQPRRGRPPLPDKVAEPVKPEVQYVDVLVDLPPHAPDVRMDGRIFQQGMTYKLASPQAASLRDIMFRAWSHEREVRGERTGFGPKRFTRG